MRRYVVSTVTPEGKRYVCLGVEDYNLETHPDGIVTFPSLEMAQSFIKERLGHLSKYVLVPEIYLFIYSKL